MSSTYIVHVSARLAASCRGRSSNATGWLLSSAQLRTSARTASAITVAPAIHCATRHSERRLATARLAVPPLADRGHVVRIEPGAPDLARRPRSREAFRISQKAQGGVRD